MKVIGTSTGCRSVTVCRAAALNAASVEMAAKMGQDLRGKAMRDMGVDEGAEMPAEYNRFQEACISKFQGAIKGELEESFALTVKEWMGLIVMRFTIWWISSRHGRNAHRLSRMRWKSRTYVMIMPNP